MKRTHIVLACALFACGGTTAPPKAAEPAAPPLHLAPVADLVPAAGLEWLVVAQPREIAAREDLIVPIHTILSEERLSAFASATGGVDLRFVEELTVARYAQTTLYLARTKLDPARIEAAFASHVVAVEGRAVDRKGPQTQSIVRVWGEEQGERAQIAVFGVDGVGLEAGRFGPLRAAELFAEDRLKRASPALRAVPLARAAELVGEAPIRAFAPGPFSGELAKGFGGLLAGSTALAIAVRFPSPPARAASDPPTAPVAISLVLLGAWNQDALQAAERLDAAYATLASAGLGRLCGLDRPLVPPRTRARDDAVILDVTVDGVALAHGLHSAVDAQVTEIMGRVGKSPPLR